MAATGGRPAFAAALTIPFFQDNLLKDESNDISRKIFEILLPNSEHPEDLANQISGF